jgi:hypothetical protein
MPEGAFPDGLALSVGLPSSWENNNMEALFKLCAYSISAVTPKFYD